MAQVGVHYILELFRCPAQRLDDAEFVKDALRRAAGVARSTLLQEVSHRFLPQGVTALALLAESHISIHTWPENGYAAADIFTCGQSAEPEAACRFLIDELGAQEHVMRRINRGSCPAEEVIECGSAQPPENSQQAGSAGDDGRLEGGAMDRGAVGGEREEDVAWRARSYARISG